MKGDNAPPPDEWSVPVHPCPKCEPHQWHATECACGCETSCHNPVIVPKCDGCGRCE